VRLGKVSELVLSELVRKFSTTLTVELAPVASRADGAIGCISRAGVIVGFGGDGWPLVRPEATGSDEAVDEQSKHAGRAVIAAQLAVDFKAPLMRGQRVLLQLAAAISESQQVQCRELATSVQTENTAPSSSLAEESSQEAWILVSILAATSGPEKRRCIHPTRVASLCNNCPRRKGSGSRGMQLRSCSGAVEKEQRWARGLEVLECIR
ncbi:unnamed protein product, partial [Polarella glacialis]